MANIGRNQPCPCGSGKKYKHCCIDKPAADNPHAAHKSSLPSDPALIKSLLGSETELDAYQKAVEKLVESDPTAPTPSFREWQGKPNNASALMNSALEEISNRVFGSKEELEDFLSQRMAQINQKGIDDFLGLSSSQMSHLLDPELPFALPGQESAASLVRLDFQAVNRHTHSIPLLRLAQWLLAHLAQGPVKLTAAGYLPTALVKECYQEVLKPNPFWSHDAHELPGFEVKRQIDLPILDMLLPLLGKLGLFKKRSGSYSITAQGSTWIKQSPPEQYELLYHGVRQKLDWQDHPNPRLGYPHPHIQGAWNFNLNLLRQRAASWVSPEKLGQLWLRAFPQVIHDYGVNPQEPTDQDGNYRLLSPMDRLASFVAWYAFKLYPRALGLIEFKPYEKGFFELDTLRTTQLFQELVTLDC